MSSGSFWLRFLFNFIWVNAALTLIKYISPILYYIAIILCLTWLVGDYIRDFKLKNRLKLIKILDKETNDVAITNEIFYDVVKEELKIKEDLKRLEREENLKRLEREENLRLKINQKKIDALRERILRLYEAIKLDKTKLYEIQELIESGEANYTIYLKLINRSIKDCNEQLEALVRDTKIDVMHSDLLRYGSITRDDIRLYELHRYENRIKEEE